MSAGQAGLRKDIELGYIFTPPPGRGIEGVGDCLCISLWFDWEAGIHQGFKAT